MLASDIQQYITLGDLFVLAVLALFVIYLIQRDRRDMMVKQFQVVVDELKTMNSEHEQRLRGTEDAIIRLTAIQERQDIEINSIKHRHERLDEGMAVERRKADRT